MSHLRNAALGGEYDVTRAQRPFRKCGKCAFQRGLSADVARVWAEYGIFVGTGMASGADLPQMRQKDKGWKCRFAANAAGRWRGDVQGVLLGVTSCTRNRAWSAVRDRSVVQGVDLENTFYTRTLVMLIQGEILTFWVADTCSHQ